jgi:hypothetical protein
VAIPAVLAYNAFVKSNRNIMSSLENFAQDLHILLTTGAPLSNSKIYAVDNALPAENAGERNAGGVQFYAK